MPELLLYLNSSALQLSQPRSQFRKKVPIDYITYEPSAELFLLEMMAGCLPDFLFPFKVLLTVKVNDNKPLFRSSNSLSSVLP